mgnify:FL=1
MNDEFIVMPRAELIETLSNLLDERIEAQLAPLKSIIAVKQKEACSAIGITDDTARNRVEQGEVSALQRDGSRLVYFTLEVMPGLKPRRIRNRK